MADGKLSGTVTGAGALSGWAWPARVAQDCRATAGHFSFSGNSLLPAQGLIADLETRCQPTWMQKLPVPHATERRDHAMLAVNGWLELHQLQ